MRRRPSSADPLETMPFRFGPLGLSPTLAVTNFGVDDNIFNDAADPKRDFTMTVTPRLQARLRSGKVLLSGTVATGLVYYQKYDDERSIDYAADGRVDFDFGWFQPYALGVAARHARAAECRAGRARPAARRRRWRGRREGAALAEDRARVRRAGRPGCDFEEGDDVRWRAAERVAQLDHQDSRGRPRVLPHAADDASPSSRRGRPIGSTSRRRRTRTRSGFCRRFVWRRRRLSRARSRSATAASRRWIPRRPTTAGWSCKDR